MPFTKYLQHTSGYDAPPDEPSSYSHPVEFQLPQFMYSGPPTLAPGGGAEVLPFSTSGSLVSAWFTNSGFSTGSASSASGAGSASSASIKCVVQCILPVSL